MYLTVRPQNPQPTEVRPATRGLLRGRGESGEACPDIILTFHSKQNARLGAGPRRAMCTP